MQSRNDPKSNLVEQLFSREAELARKAARLSFPFRLSPASIGERLLSLPEPELVFIGGNLANLSAVFDVCIQTGMDPWDDNEFLRISMRHLSLSFPGNFFDVVETDHVVEAYDMHRRQIFRNIRFMEISNYSLLQVLSYEWPMLFHRPIEITNAIIKQGEQDLWSGNKLVRCEIPRHVIREILSDKPQICEVQQQYFAPLFFGPNRPGGALVVCSAKPLGLDSTVDHESLSFI